MALRQVGQATARPGVSRFAGQYLAFSVSWKVRGAPGE